LNLYQYLFPFIIQKKKEIDFLIKYSDEIYKWISIENIFIKLDYNEINKIV